MPRKSNVWKLLPFAIAPTPPEGSTSASPVPSNQPNGRVRTSRQVKRAYQARQALASTPSGVYLFNRDPPLVPESGLDTADPGSPSTSHPTSPHNSSRYPRSSPPLNDGHGWTSDYPGSPQPTSGFAHYRSNRANQWRKWTDVIIPQLVQPYLQLLHRSDSLSSVDRQFSPLCTCGHDRARTLKVMCIHFDCEYMVLVRLRYHH